MSAAINRLDSSEQPFAGVSLTATQAERLLSICVTMIDLCAEVTGKLTLRSEPWSLTRAKMS